MNCTLVKNLNKILKKKEDSFYLYHCNDYTGIYIQANHCSLKLINLANDFQKKCGLEKKQIQT